MRRRKVTISYNYMADGLVTVCVKAPALFGSPAFSAVTTVQHGEADREAVYRNLAAIGLDRYIARLLRDSVAVEWSSPRGID